MALLEPTFGGINLEDTKAPECFAIEAKLRRRMNIPVFHDDQHETRQVLEIRLKRAGASATMIQQPNEEF